MKDLNISFLSSQGISVENLLNWALSDHIFTPGIYYWVKGFSFRLLCLLFFAQGIKTVKNSCAFSAFFSSREISISFWFICWLLFLLFNSFLKLVAFIFNFLCMSVLILQKLIEISLGSSRIVNFGFESALLELLLLLLILKFSSFHFFVGLLLHHLFP